MIKCEICGAEICFVELHLKESHPEMSVEKYKKQFPEAPLFSDDAKAMLDERLKEWEGNPVRQYSIESLFGFEGFGKTKQVSGRTRKTEFVPEVDEFYSFRKELLSTVLYALERSNEPLLLIGPTGSGKTSVVEQACARLLKPVTRVNLDGDITRSDFVGQWVLNGKNTMTFNYGPLPVAMREGRVLIVDEIDAGAAPVVMVLQAVLEGKPLVILETGETIKPHPEFRICATANTNGQGDESGMYFGTQPQNYAMFDRFKLVDKVDYPTNQEEHGILHKKLGMEDVDLVRTKLIEVATLIRQAHVKGECSCTMSTRNVINIAEKMIAFGSPSVAYKVGFLNKLGGDDLDFCNEIIQRVWG